MEVDEDIFWLDRGRWAVLLRVGVNFRYFRVVRNFHGLFKVDGRVRIDGCKFYVFGGG